jgi:outer membrane protein OmpA-like peptidoglycan-associated protein
MKTRMFLALLLSTVIALPALAQQTNAGSGAPPAASASQTPASPGVTASGEPLQTTRGDFWDGDEPGLAALILHPFASKDYVRRQTVPIRDRVNELEEITAGHANAIKDADTRAQQGIQLASKKTDEADQHALEASNKAQLAQQTASAANTHFSRVETVVGNIDQYKAGAQTVLRFRPGQSVLSKDAKDALDEMATRLKDQHGYVIEVRGFCSGRGQAAIAASKRTSSSRIEISVLKNGVDQLASTSASDAGTSPK